jgi:splicing factor 1
MSDVYKYEVAQQEAEEFKRIHAPMKAWYKTSTLQSQLGDFPLFWRDLAAWPHYRVAFRCYNHWLETKDAPKPETSTVTIAAAPIPAATKTDETFASSSSAASLLSAATSGASLDEAGGARKKRRWGDTSVVAPSAETNNSATVADASQPIQPSAPPKRKNRWDPEPESTPSVIMTSVAPTHSPLPKLERRKRRWGARAINAAVALLPPSASLAQEALFVFRVRIEELQMKMQLVPHEAARISSDPNRPPSPTPEYDSTGKRTNSREQRMMRILTEQRDRTLEKLVDLNPSLASPGPKFMRKLYIPWRDYPNYNFIGLVIGPRGNTQKKLEKETNCKISVRGKGSGKEGAASVPKSKARAEEDEDEMHVQVHGTKLSETEAAATLIADLLRPIDDDTNEWKKKQLMELAAINGTLRDLSAPCNRCGEPGHRHYECPYGEAKDAAKRIQVLCLLCGDGGHVTSDCKLRSKSSNGGNPPAQEDKAQVALESEYLSFMADLGDGTAKARLAQIEQTNSKTEKPSAQTQNPSNSAHISSSLASSSSSAFLPLKPSTPSSTTLVSQSDPIKPAETALTLQQQQEQLAAYFAQQHMVIQYYKSAGYDMGAYEAQLGTQIAAAAAAAQAGTTFAVPTSGATIPGTST